MGMWKSIRENPRAVVYAVLMHLVLLVLLVVGLDWTPKAIKPGVKIPIEAELVSSDELKVIEQRKREEEQQRQAAAEAKRRQEEEARQQKAEAEQRAAEEAAAEKRRQAEIAAQKKAEAEKKRKAEIAAQKKAEAEKQRKAEEARLAAKKAAAEAEKKRKAEEARLAAKKAAAEAERKAAEARQREAEEALRAQLAEEEARARAQSALAEYIPYIQERIQRNWLRPAGSPAGLTCLVKVRLIPGGDVVSVSVVRSSGDAVFDRSVETAVLKASPLPLPEDTELFKYFREINFNFDPGR